VERDTCTIGGLGWAK